MKQSSRLPNLPQSVPEFLAYQLARRLDDDENTNRYISLTKRFSVASLLQAYRNADAGSDTIRDRRRLFWEIIERSSTDE
jgi:hypothetical protein